MEEDKKEFKDELQLHSPDTWPGIEGPLEMSYVILDDYESSDEMPSTLSEKGPSITPAKKGPSNTPAEKGPSITPTEKGPSITPSENGISIMRSAKGSSIIKYRGRFNKRSVNRASITTSGDETLISEKGRPTKQRSTTIQNDFSFPFGQPPWNWPPIEKYSTMRPLKPLPPFEWKHEDFPTPKYEFNFEVPRPRPSTEFTMRKSFLILKLVMGVVALAVALFGIYKLKSKKNRTRRGAVLADRADAVEQDPQTNRITPSETGEADPQTNDMPPPYQQCMIYNMNEHVGNVPRPNTSQEDQKQRQDTLIEKERRACSENVAPEMRTELVFDSGRVVERSSLDANSKTNKPIAGGQSKRKK